MKKYDSYKPILKNWLYGIAFYFIPFIIGYLAFSFVLSDNVLHTDVDSARYMLSALIQSEAAIVALVVTLSLVAVQLAASSYSARVIEVFRKAPDLWILMGIYGIAIFYGLGVLKMIEKANPQLCNSDIICQSNLEGHIAFSYYLGVFAFVALGPYMWRMLEMLKPSTVIDMLAERITKNNMLAAIGEDIWGEVKSVEKDPIQPIIDIVRGSLMKYDYETLKDGLRAIGEKAETILKNENGEGEDKLKVLKPILVHLTRVGELAANRKDVESTLAVIVYLKKIGLTSTNQKFVGAANHIVFSLSEIGKAAAEQKLDDVIIDIILSLQEIGITAVKHGLKETTQVVADSLGEIGVIAAKQKLEEVLVKLVRSLKKVGKAAAEQEFKFATVKAVDSLRTIGEAVAEQKLEDVMVMVILSIEEVGKAAAEKKLDYESRNIESYRQTMRNKLERMEDRSATQEAIFSLGKLGKAASTHKLEEAIQQAVLCLGYIGRATAEQKFEFETMQAAKSLGILGTAAAEQKLNDEARKASDFLEEIAKIVRRQEHSYSLNSVETAIREINESLNKIEKN